MLTVRNLDVAYGKLRVLEGVSLHVRAGEIVTIIGANGAGKSTLLKTLAGLLKPRGGSITLFDQDAAKMSPADRVFGGCVLVPEGRQLFPPMTVHENLLLGGYSQYKRRRKQQVQESLESNYDLFPILRERRNQYAGTLSGGEQQMLAIARALMAKPRLVMLDEPSMGLAPLIVRNIFQIIVKLREQGITVLLVEQNAKAALAIADRGYVVETGQVTLGGSSSELLHNNDVQRAYLGKDYRRIDELGR